MANGRVIDPERGLDGIRSVGIRNGRIEAISRTPLRGRKVLDASGLVVAPGFIDLHSHGQDLPGARMQAFDGVTTSLELEAGAARRDAQLLSPARSKRQVGRIRSARHLLRHLRGERSLKGCRTAHRQSNLAYRHSTP
ncbi:MAG: amidohydrolase family protein [Gemmatimonadaceae bacterium]|nr:amidohydrolase family protein [Gemmatimonadaceae bacterium]